MKIKVFTTKSKEPIPFNYQQFLTGALHKWLGKNDLHGCMSEYSFSWLQGQYVRKKEGLLFPEGASYFISSHNPDILRTLINGIRKQPEICFGLNVSEILILPEPDFSIKTDFHTVSPIFCKRTLENNEKHFTYEDNEWADIIKETLLQKMKQAGLEQDQSLEIKHLKNDSSRVKIIHYKQIGNKVSLCNIKINAKPETKEFAWNVGLGNSTGIGFGAII